MGRFFSSKSSWTSEIQPNDTLWHRLVEFMVFSSAWGWWPSLISAFYIMTIINFLRSLKKVLSKHSQFPKSSFAYTQWNVNCRGKLSWNFFQRSQKTYYRHDVIGTIEWRPSAEGQPNGTVRRSLVEFLVFNSNYLKKSGTTIGINRVSPHPLPAPPPHLFYFPIFGYFFTKLEKQYLFLRFLADFGGCLSCINSPFLIPDFGDLAW